MRNVCLLFLICVLSPQSLNAQDHVIDKKITVSISYGRYFIGWSPLVTGKTFVSSDVVFKSIYLSRQVYKKPNLDFSLRLGFRNLDASGFFSYVGQKEVLGVQTPTSSNYLSVGVTSLAYYKKRHSFGLNLDLMIFAEKEFDFYEQNRVVSELDVIYQFKLFRNILIGIKSPIKVLPYASWKFRYFDLAEPKILEEQVRVGVIGASATLAYRF